MVVVVKVACNKVLETYDLPRFEMISYKNVSEIVA